MACLPQLGGVPAAYAVVAGGCDWPIQERRHFVTFLTFSALRALRWMETPLKSCAPVRSECRESWSRPLQVLQA